MASNPHGLAVGSTVWAFGRADAPTAYAITSETSRSWVTADGQKIPKSHAEPIFEANGIMITVRYCLTREAADALLLERMRWKMGQAIRENTDTNVLRLVAAALGMPTGVAP